MLKTIYTCNFKASNSIPLELKTFLLKGGGNIQSLFEKKIFFFGNTPPGGKKCEKHENRKIKIPSHDQTTQTDMPYVKKQHYGTPLCIYTSENFYNKFLSKKSIFSINFLLDFFIFLDFSIFCCFRIFFQNDWKSEKSCKIFRR